MNSCSNHIIFAEYLEELAKHSRKIGNMRGLDNGFVELQKLRARIERNGDRYFGIGAYRKLVAIAILLENDYREAIELNRRVKEIEKEHRKQNRQREVA